ncbi:MAG: universal stress protein [Microcystaceae cyanobacterium]
MTYQKVFAAIDQSDLGKQVFEQAVAIAKPDGASLMLFHCLPLENADITPYTTLYNEDIADFSRSIQEELQAQTNEVNKWLEDYGKIAIAQGIKTEWNCKIGDPSRWIRDEANTWEADLIVIGRRGLKGIAEMFLGSVSNYIVHHANCSVLVVQGSE